MFAGFWFAFIILLLAAILGSIAILPYSLRLIKGMKRKKPLKLPTPILLLVSVLQNAILFAIVIALGLLASHTLGHGAPVLNAIYQGSVSNQSLISTFSLPFVLGIAAGVGLFLLDLLFLPYFPEKLLKTALETTTLENFTASFYGGINEELIMRLFGVSVIAWLLIKVLSQQTTLIFWSANVVMAFIFAIGHLPATKNLVGKLTTPLFFRAIVLNTPIGLLCGWVFWNYGIGAAILTHFTADIVYHVGGTIVLRKIKK